MIGVEEDMVNPLPVELADGLIWLGNCVPIPSREDKVKIHSGDSLFLIVGEHSCGLVESAYTYNAWDTIEQLAKLIEERDLPPIRYIFITHSELAHCGGVGHLLTKFTEAVCCGEPSDLHLIFPQFADRFVWSNVGDSYDLGGRSLQIVESVVRDMPNSRWAFDTGSHTLFTGDGFAYAHHHDETHCGHLVEEVDPPLDIPDHMKSFAKGAFNFLEYIDIEPTINRLDEVIEELGVERICPTHGLPIGDPAATMPVVREGYRRAAANVTLDLYA